MVNGMIEKIAIGLVVVLAVAIVATFTWKEMKKEKINKQISDQIEQELAPYNLEKEKIQTDLEQLEINYDRELGKGTVVILFPDISEKIYTEFYPILNEYGYKAALTVSQEQFPGKEGCLTAEQFQELLNAGWNYCIQWHEDVPLEKWVFNFKNSLRSMRISASNIMYFPSGMYQQKYDRALEAFGFKAAVHHGEEGRPVVEMSGEGKVWHLGVAKMGEEGTQELLEKAILEKGAMALSIEFDQEEETEEVDEEDILYSRLNTLEPHTKSERLQIVGFADVKAYLNDKETRAVSAEENRRVKKEELENALAEVQKQIDDVYVKYGK